MAAQLYTGIWISGEYGREQKLQLLCQLPSDQLLPTYIARTGDLYIHCIDKMSTYNQLSTLYWPDFGPKSRPRVRLGTTDDALYPKGQESHSRLSRFSGTGFHKNHSFDRRGDSHAYTRMRSAVSFRRRSRLQDPRDSISRKKCPSHFPRRNPGHACVRVFVCRMNIFKELKNGDIESLNILSSFSTCIK